MEALRMGEQTWGQWWLERDLNNFYFHFPLRGATKEMMHPSYPQMAERFDSLDDVCGSMEEHHSPKCRSTTHREFYEELRAVTDELGVDQLVLREEIDAAKGMDEAAQHRLSEQVRDVYLAMLEKGYWHYDLIS